MTSVLFKVIDGLPIYAIIIDGRNELASSKIYDNLCNTRYLLMTLGNTLSFRQCFSAHLHAGLSTSYFLPIRQGDILKDTRKLGGIRPGILSKTIALLIDKLRARQQTSAFRLIR